MDNRNVDRIVRSALAAGVVEASPHPDPDTLFQYHAGELSAAEADSVQAHLAVCQACARAVLDFELFPHLDAPSDADVPTAEEIEAGWTDVQARLRAAREHGAPVEAPHAPRSKVVSLTPRDGVPRLVAPPARRAPVWLQALAAVLAVATLGLGMYVVALRAPRAGEILTLQPRTQQDRAEGASLPPPAFKLDADKPALNFALVLPHEAGPGPFSATVRHSKGGFDVSRLSNAKGLVIFNPGRFKLPGGAYEIDLCDAAGALVAEYAFTLNDD